MSRTLPASVRRAAPVLRPGALAYAEALFDDGFRIHMDNTCAAAAGATLTNASSVLQFWLKQHPNSSQWWDKYAAEALIPHMVLSAPSVLTNDWRTAHASIVVLPVWQFGGTLLAPERCRRLLWRESAAFRETRGARHFFVLTADRGPCCFDGDMMLPELARHHVIGNHGELPGHHWRHKLAWRQQNPPNLPCFDARKDISFPTPLPILRGGASRAERRRTPAGQERTLLGFYVGGGLMATGLREGRALLKIHFNASTPDIFVRSNLPPDQVVDAMGRAKYCMIMGGYAPWTPRLVQAIDAGCVPVICSSWLPPFSRVLDWTRFSVRVGSLEDIPLLRSTLLQQNYESLAAGVAFVRDALIYNHHTASVGVLPFLQLEMALALGDATSLADSLTSRADQTLGVGSWKAFEGQGESRVDYTAMTKKIQWGASDIPEGVVRVRTRDENNVSRAWHCAPTVGHGHFLNIRSPMDPSNSLEADPRPKPQSCHCVRTEGPVKYTAFR